MESNRYLRLLPVNDDASTSHRQSSADPQGAQGDGALTAFSFDPELAQGYYVVLPSDFLCSTAFTPTAKVLYALLLHYANLGAQYWPGETTMAEECAASEEPVCEAMQSLLAAGLVSYQPRDGKREAVYTIHSFHPVHSVPHIQKGRGAISHATSTTKLHIPQEQHNINKEQVQNDSQLLVDKVGISKATAKSLAQLAAERRCSKGYVAEVADYALTTPGIKNPAGCVVELIRRNESRKPGNSLSHQDGVQTLDKEKYTTGKYAFLFQRQNGQAAAKAAAREATREGSSGQGAEQQDAEVESHEEGEGEGEEES